MSLVTYSVQRRLFQFDIDGFLYSSSLHGCSAFVSASSLFLMADSDALMRSTTGICSEVPQSSVTSAGTSFSGRVSSLLDKFFTHSSCMSGFRFNMTWMTERSLHSLSPVTKLNTPTNRWISMVLTLINQQAPI